MLLDAAYTITSAGGCPVSFICDNHATNRSVYAKLGGPGKMNLESIGHFVYGHVYLFFQNQRLKVNAICQSSSVKFSEIMVKV